MEHRKPISPEQFDAALKNATHRIFRIESLPEYNVPGDRAVFNDFASGVPLPDLTSTGALLPWFTSIKEHCSRGVQFQRLRVLPDRINPYLRYEIEWCYTHSAQFGEETRLVHMTHVPKQFLIDAYVVDDDRVFYIEYDRTANWTGFSEPITTAEATSLVKALDPLWENAQPLKEFLSTYRNTLM